MKHFRHLFNLCLLMGGLFSGLPGAHAHTALPPVAFDDDLRALVNSEAVKPCDIFLRRANLEFKTALPEPSAVVIDKYAKRILFAVEADQVAHWKKVENLNPKVLDKGDAKIFRRVRSGEIWIDVTEGIPFASAIFKMYGKGPPVSKYCCYAGAAAANYLNGVDSTLIGMNRISEKNYLNIGFHEVSAEDARWADVAYIYYSMARSASLVPVHAFVPIPGTQWAFHKAGFDGGPRIERVDSIIGRYPKYPYARIVRYFAKTVHGELSSKAKWVESLFAIEERNRQLAEELNTIGLPSGHFTPTLDEAEVELAMAYGTCFEWTPIWSGQKIRIQAWNEHGPNSNTLNFKIMGKGLEGGDLLNKIISHWLYSRVNLNGGLFLDLVEPGSEKVTASLLPGAVQNLLDKSKIAPNWSAHRNSVVISLPSKGNKSQANVFFEDLLVAMDQVSGPTSFTSCREL